MSMSSDWDYQGTYMQDYWLLVILLVKGVEKLWSIPVGKYRRGLQRLVRRVG